MAQKMLGLDLGGYQLKIAQVKGKRLQKYAVEQMPDNLIKEGKITSFHAMADFIKETVKKHRISGHETAIALPPEAYFLRRVKLPRMTMAQLKVNLPFEFRDYITGELGEYEYDYAVLSIDENGMDLMAAAILKTTIAQYRAMAHRAGLKLVKLVPDVLGISSILMPDPEWEAHQGKDFAVLDMGHTSTRMYFFSNGAYEITRTLDSGGPQMARLVADERNVDIHIAHLYLEHNQDNILDDPAIVDLYEQVDTEVMRVMNFYSYNNPNNNIDRIYYMGGGVNVSRLMAGIREDLGVEVRPLSDLIQDSRGFEFLNLGPQAYGIVTE